MAYALKKDPGTVLCYRKVNFSVNQPREHEAVITNRHIRIGIRPRSAGWWLVAGLIWRERKILLDSWLVGGWADFAWEKNTVLAG